MYQQINLYKPEFRVVKERFSGDMLLSAIAIMIVCTVGVVGSQFWFLTQDRMELNDINGKISTSNNKLSGMKTALALANNSNASLDQTVKNLEKQVRAQQLITEIIKEDLAASSKGYSQIFESLAKQHLPGVWLTGIRLDNDTEEFTLKGKSTDSRLVPRYLQKLSLERSLSGIQFQVFRMKHKTNPKNKKSKIVDFLMTTVDKIEEIDPFINMDEFIELQKNRNDK